MTPAPFNPGIQIWSAALAFAALLSCKGARADDIYVANFNESRIYKFDSAGHASVFADSSAGLQYPYSLAFDARGDLFVACFQNIIKIDPAGHGSVFASLGTDPSGLAFDGNGNLYVSTIANSILKYSPQGSLSVFASSGLNNPEGLAFDSSGSLYVANEGNNNILKYDAAGHSSVFAQTASPVGIAFDKRGYLFTANLVSFTITEFDRAGHGSVFADQTSGLYYPDFLAFDSSGNLFAANEGNGPGSSILEYDPNGNATLFATPAENTSFSGVVTQIPEPSMCTLAAFGAGALIVLRGRKRLGTLAA